ncbi:MAG: hypothetical protein KDA37_09205, partial [Planctomycetales bacterium]|nr:hypothetical protein [Planctomycetales bacterium]
VRLHEGVVKLILSFDRLTVDDRAFRNFKVHAVFLPQATTEGVWLVQNEPVQIEGRMRAVRRANLHGVFGQIMPAGKRFTVATTKPEQQQRLAGLMVTQVVVDDGWLGMALGPNSEGRVAIRARFVR